MAQLVWAGCADRKPAAHGVGVWDSGSGSRRALVTGEPDESHRRRNAREMAEAVFVSGRSDAGAASVADFGVHRRKPDARTDFLSSRFDRRAIVSGGAVEGKRLSMGRDGGGGDLHGVVRGAAVAVAVISGDTEAWSGVHKRDSHGAAGISDPDTFSSGGDRFPAKPV